MTKVLTVVEQHPELHSGPSRCASGRSGERNVAFVTASASIPGAISTLDALVGVGRNS